MSGARWTADEAAAFMAKREKQQDANRERLMKKAVECLKPALEKVTSLPADTPETIIQQNLISWFKVKYKDIYDSGALFAVPNEGKRSRANASRMKAEGLLSAVSDLILLVPRGGYHGFCMEMKKKGKKPSADQAEWLSHRRLSGYYAEYYDTLESAQAAFDIYLNLK